MDPTSTIETDARIAMFERLIEEREAEEKTANAVDDATDKAVDNAINKAVNKAIDKAITKKLVKKLTKKLTKKLNKNLVKNLKEFKQTEEKLTGLERKNAILEKELQEANQKIARISKIIDDALAGSDRK
jgi:predicted ribosome quality control (RQC) complex YloA/Tae2 family protein